MVFQHFDTTCLRSSRAMPGRLCPLIDKEAMSVGIDPFPAAHFGLVQKPARPRDIARPLAALDLKHPPALRQPGGFVFCGEPPFGREVIDHAGEMLTQRGEQFIALHACLLHEIPNPVLAEGGL